uniref:Uncharacterized protein n=1 Tax=Knipowitschia caucasica TaxID=637954 RepID=A0AAV2L748_KNICA
MAQELKLYARRHPEADFVELREEALLRALTVSPNSERLVWGKTRMGPDGTDYLALVEALSDTGEVGVARTIGVVRNRMIPLRVCNPHPYSYIIGRYQKLGRIYRIDYSDVHGPEDVNLSLG